MLMTDSMIDRQVAAFNQIEASEKANEVVTS
jgi:hypothetical protein